MKKIGFIVLAVVLALGAMGAAYAAWGQNLVFSGTVASGTYVVNLTDITAVQDTHGVATLSATAGPAVASTVVAANLYPGATEKVTFKIANTGSIPAKVNATVQYTGVPELGHH